MYLQFSPISSLFEDYLFNIPTIKEYLIPAKQISLEDKIALNNKSDVEVRKL